MPTSTPNYLTVDTLGRVIALFTGGVQINALQEVYFSPPGDFGSTPSSQQSVSWIDTKLGGVTGYVAVRTQIAGVSNTETKRIATLAADSNSPNNVTPGTIPAQAQLQATAGNYANPGGPPKAAVQASYDGSVSPAGLVRAFAGSFNKKVIDSNGASDFVQVGTAFERNTGGTDVAVPNDNVFRDVLRGDGNPLGTGAQVTVTGAQAPSFLIGGNAMFLANSDIWTLAEIAVVIVNVSTGAENEILGGRVRAHSYGVTNDTGRPQYHTMTAHGIAAMAAPGAGVTHTFRVGVRIRCFGGLGGGSYTRDVDLGGHVYLHRVI